jgi:hypothetical protein
MLTPRIKERKFSELVHLMSDMLQEGLIKLDRAVIEP